MGWEQPTLSSLSAGFPHEPMAGGRSGSGQDRQLCYTNSFFVDMTMKGRMVKALAIYIELSDPARVSIAAERVSQVKNKTSAQAENTCGRR
jgi:hypothetical protein